MLMKTTTITTANNNNTQLLLTTKSKELGLKNFSPIKSKPQNLIFIFNLQPCSSILLLTSSHKPTKPTQFCFHWSTNGRI